MDGNPVDKDIYTFECGPGTDKDNNTVHNNAFLKSAFFNGIGFQHLNDVDNLPKNKGTGQNHSIRPVIKTIL